MKKAGPMSPHPGTVSLVPFIFSFYRDHTTGGHFLPICPKGGKKTQSITQTQGEALQNGLQESQVPFGK